MRLLTNPPCLDGGGQRAQIRRRRKIVTGMSCHVGGDQRVRL
jgi:hypothetical protein